MPALSAKSVGLLHGLPGEIHHSVFVPGFSATGRALILQGKEHSLIGEQVSRERTWCPVSAFHRP
jgi:hypothetical protein